MREKVSYRNLECVLTEEELMEKREIELRGTYIIEKNYTGTMCGSAKHFNWIKIAEFKNKADAELCFLALSK
ncbi:MAG: hypothetical protein KC517_09130 [Bacteroidetes bacterium]|nr:hypothetical protein [Bacteroidota bacterium]